MANGMTWVEFEMLVGEAFRLQGYKAEETGGGGADGGIDLVLTRDRERFLVQCKQWRAFSVGVEVVRELYGVMAASGATGGFVVTSGRFTRAAHEFADGRNIQLIDAPKLHALLEPATSASSRKSAASSSVVQTPSIPELSSVSQPHCPTCGKPMVQRTAKRGAKAGNEFWGCSGYPGCRATRPIS
jgi:restriction system protein